MQELQLLHTFLLVFFLLFNLDHLRYGHIIAGSTPIEAITAVVGANCRSKKKGRRQRPFSVKMHATTTEHRGDDINIKYI